MNQVRGIVVVDVGYTHSKVLLFDDRLNLVEAREFASSHPDDGPYAMLDIEPFLKEVRDALPELDAICPVDRIIPSAHGSALALTAADGEIVLPVMDYAAQPPSAIKAAYQQIAPDFSEVFAPVLPGALTLGLQLYWQQSKHPEQFAKVTNIMPWAQYAAYRLGGRPATEVTALGAQTQLLDVRAGGYSSLARQQSWDGRFAPMAKAFEALGSYSHAEMHGDATILAGIHDSNANYLRYLATGRDDFTLLSSGTWIIGFTPGIDLTTIDPRRDVVSNTDYLGRPVASCRFMGGQEFMVIAAGADPSTADLETTARLIERGSLALPAFTDSGGPIPNCPGQGRFLGPSAESVSERASLASLYCALMSWQSLLAVGGRSDVIVDGPFARNDVYLSCLAGLIPGRSVFASESSQGTAIGAALLGLCGPLGELPDLPAKLRAVQPFEHATLQKYADNWISLAESQPAQK